MVVACWDWLVLVRLVVIAGLSKPGVHLDHTASARRFCMPGYRFC
jgi:hypothetical protein